MRESAGPTVDAQFTEAIIVVVVFLLCTGCCMLCIHPLMLFNPYKNINKSINEPRHIPGEYQSCFYEHSLTPEPRLILLHDCACRQSCGSF